MPSPFPGMNPFLEQEEVWQDFHQRFITYSAAAYVDHVLPPRDQAAYARRVRFGRSRDRRVKYLPQPIQHVYASDNRGGPQLTTLAHQ